MKFFIDLISPYFIDVLQILILILFIFLKAFNLIDGNLLFFVSVVIVGSIGVRNVINLYLNYILQVRQTNIFPDNRSANFLTFDGMKFLLILIALIAVIILGLNRVLNNETIATLLGGLIGSLLSMRGSYNDLDPKNFSNNNLESNSGSPKS